ncbi:hypothetical protein F0562_034097 [Nyssa sinensis]|uniref:Phosphatidic acid phosphatase type 2/haloperoxidase domain-containing protein n=1 Tax=Nyssa sinensis TaxID=561372 RepID=A0A5J5AFR3_9ASTE|nr:hypothetical protein F0562_034097 [Nyssa sinensis]
MREGEFCGHTIKSHGATVARNHMHDWIILLLLVIIEVVLNVIYPFYRFVGKEMMTDLKYPLKENTVPVWAVPIYAILLPVAIFLLFYLRRRDVYDLHHSILVGRPRPDFFWRCFPDGMDEYDRWGNVVCHGKDSVIKEGHKSFPSGHTSWSFAGLGFLSLYLSGKIKAFDRRGHVAKLCIVFLPLLIASLVGVSRVDDYWHHWQDVFAGGLLGLVVAIFCYLQFFPAPYHTEGWGPYEYFRALEELRANPQLNPPANGLTLLATEGQVVNQQSGPHSNAFIPLGHNSSSSVVDIESGRRSAFSFSSLIGTNSANSHIRLIFFTGKMPEILLGAHTIRSHGVTVARKHKYDWLILMLLVATEFILNFIEPFHRFVGPGMMTDLKYPLKSNTIPFWAVPVIAILLPLPVIVMYYFIRRDVYDLHHAILGLLFSVLITGVLTDAIKDAVGRPRPDFFWRCFPDGKGVFDPVTMNVKCTGLKSVIKEGHKSFPSGHTSWSFAGLGFLAWYLSGKVRVFDRRGHVAKLCIVFLPLLIAALVGVSRVDDYWHHWQDVFAGGLLGIAVASFCYLQFFPPPYDIDGWGPHAYFQMLADNRNVDQSPSTNTNGLTLQSSELDNVYIQSHHVMATSEGISRNASPILDGMESGRRF